ncbi:MAG: hypothetical protein PHZ12_09570 [Paludibacter sp.]|nr:hypothetical protein [Paludibacter sp.]
MEKEQIYWLLYSLWQSKAFYYYLRGSVIPFIVPRDVKECLAAAMENMDANPRQFQKAVEALQGLEAIENKFRQNLKLVLDAKRMLFLQIPVMLGTKKPPRREACLLQRLPHHKNSRFEYILVPSGGLLSFNKSFKHQRYSEANNSTNDGQNHRSYQIFNKHIAEDRKKHASACSGIYLPVVVWFWELHY